MDPISSLLPPLHQRCPRQTIRVPRGTISPFTELSWSSSSGPAVRAPSSAHAPTDTPNSSRRHPRPSSPTDPLPSARRVRRSRSPSLSGARYPSTVHSESTSPFSSEAFSSPWSGQTRNSQGRSEELHSLASSASYSVGAPNEDASDASWQVDVDETDGLR
ncbi:hypothetical protein VTK73DRAFT_5122 [Phialemonium thermophilum]|uniref:Uncharacterized protein n=1 Tax=Phialemonium thermophilum TaxID=223376 RepID=A0ABR3V484_9PEZI